MVPVSSCVVDYGGRGRYSRRPSRLVPVVGIGAQWSVCPSEWNRRIVLNRWNTGTNFPTFLSSHSRNGPSLHGPIPTSPDLSLGQKVLSGPVRTTGGRGRGYFGRGHGPGVQRGTIPTTTWAIWYSFCTEEEVFRVSGPLSVSGVPERSFRAWKHQSLCTQA